MKNRPDTPSAAAFLAFLLAIILIALLHLLQEIAISPRFEGYELKEAPYVDLEMIREYRELFDDALLNTSGILLEKHNYILFTTYTLAIGKGSKRCALRIVADQLPTAELGTKINCTVLVKTLHQDVCLLLEAKAK